MNQTTIDALVERVRREILADFADGTLPRDGSVCGFADLHDYVDANEYGGICDADSPLDIREDDDVAIIEAMQDAIDKWLATLGAEVPVNE
jgi:hypothetical protein